MQRSRVGRVRSAALVAVATLFATAAPAQQKPARSAPASAARAASAAPAPTADYAQRFATVCAACHGAKGRSELPGMPVLAGQPALYAVTQLFLFREGRRPNEAMTAIAKTLKDEDLRGFSAYIGTLPPVPAPAPATPADPARMKKGEALALEHKCVFCHGADLAGGQQVPRIEGQAEDYLQMNLRGYKSGERVGYTRAMNEAVSQIPVEDLDTLAYYVSRFRAKGQ